MALQKNAQLPNGIRQNEKYPSQSNLAMTNGRCHTYSDKPDEKFQDDKHHESSQNALPFMQPILSTPLFAKPFKIPAHHDQHLKTRTKNHTEQPSTTTGSGGDVNSILKMMTSTYEPLSKLAATPRTEIEDQQPKKQHVYAGLPPLFRPASNPREFIFIFNSD